MRRLALWSALTLALGIAACSSSSSSGDAAQMADCCKKAGEAQACSTKK